MKRTVCNLALLTGLVAIGGGGALPAHGVENEAARPTGQAPATVAATAGEPAGKEGTVETPAVEPPRHTAPAAPGTAEAKGVRVLYIPEVVKQEIREQLKQEVLAQARAERWAEPNAVPEWVDRIKLEGDFRLRLQRDRFQPENIPESAAASFGELNGIENTTQNRTRFRLRARLGLLAKISEGVSAGVRLATGSTGDPVSTNQTLGNTGNKYSFVLDRAYLKADPYEWLSFSGGRIPNPWLGTDLVWDEDLNFEGIALALKPRLGQDLSAFVTVGGFALQDVAPRPETAVSNKWLYGAQAGLDWAASSQSRFKLGLGLFDYRNVQGIPNSGLPGSVEAHRFDKTAPDFRQKGNSVFNIAVVGETTERLALAPKFREANLTAAVDLAHFDPVHVVLQGDYVKNIGFDRDEIRRRTGLDIEPRTLGHQAKVTVGMPQLRQRRDWQVSLAYKYLQRDAVLDAFTDSDFHLGGTDAKGYILGAAYGFDKNTWLGLRWLSADSVDGPPLAIDVLQLDLNARF